MNLKLLLACALLTGIEAIAMERVKEVPEEKTASRSDEEKVTIQLSGEAPPAFMHEVQISVRLAKQVGALKTLVESPDLSMTFPLLNVTLHTWSLIEPWLEKVSSMVHDDASIKLLREEIVEDFWKLPSKDLLEVLHACDFLEIPLLVELAYEAVCKLDCACYTFEQISSLPGDLGNRLIVNKLLTKLGPVPVENLLNEWIRVEGPDDLQASCIMKDGTVISGFQDGTLNVCTIDGEIQWQAHTDIVLSITVTQDGTIVSSSGDGTIGVWDMKGKKLAHWRGHEARVQAVCVTKDCKIVSGAHDNTVRVWSMNGTPKAVFEGLGNSNVVRMTADGNLVVGSTEKLVRVLNMNGQILAECKGHEASILAVCITKDGKILSGSCDGTIRLWNMAGQQLAVYRGHARWVKSLCETKDGNIISGGKDRSVRVWDRSSGSELFVCKDHKGMIIDLSVTDDGKVVSRSQDNYMFTWDIGLLHEITRMDELHAKVLWELLRSNIHFLSNFKAEDKAQIAWLRIKELIHEKELEKKLDHWIVAMKLDAKFFKCSE